MYLKSISLLILLGIINCFSFLNSVANGNDYQKDDDRNSLRKDLEELSAMPSQEAGRQKPEILVVMSQLPKGATVCVPSSGAELLKKLEELNKRQIVK